jgi:hypothetical protein
VYAVLQRQANQERKQQLFLRGMTNGVLMERDRLLSYTTGEFYSEMSLFISECEVREKEYEKMKR